MPSTLHEVLIELFRQRPTLAAELLTAAFAMNLPERLTARLEPTDFTDLRPTEYRADAVIALSDDDGPVLAVVVEIQLRPDDDKRWSWPVYLASLRSRTRTPVVLLVLCVDQPTANWCARPIEFGHPGWQLVPLVLGPDRVPMVTEVAQAERAPELAVLSAMAHGGGPDRVRVLEALVGALGALDEDRLTLYSDIVLTALPLAARRHLEAIVKVGNKQYEYQSEFVRRYVFQGRAEGRIEGRAGAVLTVLEARGIDVPESARSRITTCTDPEQLEAWVRSAVTAGSAEDLFD